MLIFQKMLKPTLWFVITLASFCETNAYKLLLVSPLPGKSHAILADAMVELFASAGHEVISVNLIYVWEENYRIISRILVQIKKNIFK